MNKEGEALQVRNKMERGRFRYTPGNTSSNKTSTRGTGATGYSQHSQRGRGRARGSQGGNRPGGEMEFSEVSTTPYDYLMVLDFEATGDQKDSKTWEIIEFPVVIVNVKTREIEDVFHSYVKPTRHEKLSDICKEVTKIKQETVDAAPPLVDVLKSLYEWLDMKNLSNFIFVTCGDWDLRTMLPAEYKNKDLGNPPEYMKDYINIKVPFAKFILRSNDHRRSGGMAKMLKVLELELDGQHHSGIDDAKNIAKIAITLLEKGCALNQTGRGNYE